MILSSRLWIIFIVLFVATSTSLAQQKAVTISPDQPEVGDTITVTYHPGASNAKINNPDNLKLVFGFSTFYKLPDELPMEQHKNSWTASWEVPKYAKFASFYFRDGKKIDKGPGGHQYETLVYDNGKPVEDAYSRKIFSLHNRYDNQTKADSLKAKLYKQILAENTEDFSTQIRLLKTKMNLDKKRKKEFKKEAYRKIEKKYQQNSDSLETLQEVVRAYRIMGDRAKADSIRKELINKFPTSQPAIDKLYSDAHDMNHSPKKLKKLKKIAKHTEDDLNRTSVYSMLFDYYKKKGNVEKMTEFAKKTAAGKWPKKASQLNDLAHGFAEQEELKLALSYAKKALQAVPEELVGRIRQTDGGQLISGHVADSIKKSRRNRVKSKVLSTHGLIYTKMEQHKKAEEYLLKAKKLNESNSVNKNLANLYMQTDRPRQAFDAYWNILMEEPTNEEVQKKLREAYIAYHGSEEGFDSKTQKLDEKWRQKMTKKFNKQRIDRPAPSFETVTDLQGNPIDTGKLKGKILVVDLWATWCGPCIRAFPHMQKIYNAYKNNPNVKFLVLNTGWNNTIKEARKWKKKNDYTFPLYFDQNTKVTEQFGIRGIPTTFFIDEEGKIQFRKTGFEGETMVPEMKLQIEMLLDEQKSNQSSP